MCFCKLCRIHDKVADIDGCFLKVTKRDHLFRRNFCIPAHFVSNSCISASCCYGCITLFNQFCNFSIQCNIFGYCCRNCHSSIQIQFISAEVWNFFRNSDQVTRSVIHLFVTCFHIYITIFCPVRFTDESFQDLGCTFTRANKVVACMHFIHRYGLSAAPVCHDHSPESPFVSCECSTQIIIIGCRSAVVLVVRGHDRHRLCLFYNCFKTFKVDFTDCSFRNCIVLCISVCFLRVQCIMLNSNANAFV